MRLTMLAPTALFLLTASGCGVGQGLGDAATEDLVDAIAVVNSVYLVLDLSSGVVTTTTSLDQVTTNAAYRDQLMVFRAVEQGTAIQGSSATAFGHQSDEASSAGTIPRFYVGVFEVTQAQWQRLAGSTPWTTISPASLTATGSDIPAHGISLTQASAALATASSRLGRGLSLPTDAQWERSCRAGISGTFAWGEDRDETLVGTFARVAETRDGSDGPAAVGGREPNGYGLYDLHGNVWEMTSNGSLRGGSWRDSLAQARCANRQTIDRDTAHALVGLRLVLTP